MSKVYTVNWRRYYSEYEVFYITHSKEKAEQVMLDMQEIEEGKGYTFYVEEFEIDKNYGVW